MKTISIYQINENPIGEGGMGRVLSGTNPQGKKVAIKEILPEFAADWEIRMRTEKEVEILEALNNTEGVVKVYDQFPLNDNFYIVMELVEGINIEQYIQKYGAMPYEKACNYMMQILKIMQDVHEKNIVHRDMKPSNIMIRNDGRICILDFGIAKDMGGQNGATVIGTIIGSDGYMSPEQADGFSIDHRADIYALGCVLYYMLTGHHAYDTLSSDFETRSNIANTPFPKLSKHSKKSFPDKLQKILDSATDRNMMRRYQSCREFHKDLEELVSGAATNTSIGTQEVIYVTVGRENCDIIVRDEQMKISRNHLDIVYKQFTGGKFFVITDHSSNGTIVNGHRLSRGESINIPLNAKLPQVLLACDSNYVLDWKLVKQSIYRKIQQAARVAEDSKLPDPDNNVAANDAQKAVSFLDANVNFVKKTFNFSERASRKEYWYMVLMMQIVLVPYQACLIYQAANPMFVIPEVMHLLYISLAIISYVPALSLTVRRLHDIGKNGNNILWWLLAIVTVVGVVPMTVIWIIWMTKPSEPTANRWGPCPD